MAMKEYSLVLDHYGLLSLHKALLEAKFHTAPDNKLISGSPLIAAIYIQIRDQLMQSEEGDEWREWFLLRNRPDRRAQAVCLLRQSAVWGKAAPDKKREIAGNYLAPFVYDEEELQSVIAEADRPV